MLVDRIVKAFVGSKFDRDMREIAPVVRRINELEPQMVKLAPDEFPRRTESFRAAIRDGAELDSILPEAFALAREAARRLWISASSTPRFSAASCSTTARSWR